MCKWHKTAYPTRFYAEGDEILNEIKLAYILSNLPRESEPYDLNGNNHCEERLSGGTLAA